MIASLTSTKKDIFRILVQKAHATLPISSGALQRILVNLKIVRSEDREEVYRHFVTSLSSKSGGCLITLLPLEEVKSKPRRQKDLQQAPPQSGLQTMSLADLRLLMRPHTPTCDGLGDHLHDHQAPEGDLLPRGVAPRHIHEDSHSLPTGVGAPVGIKALDDGASGKTLVSGELPSRLEAVVDAGPSTRPLDDVSESQPLRPAKKVHVEDKIPPAIESNGRFASPVQQCLDDKRDFSTACSYRHHWGTKHDSTTFPCGTCGQVFENQVKLKKHIKHDCGKVHLCLYEYCTATAPFSCIDTLVKHTKHTTTIHIP